MWRTILLVSVLMSVTAANPIAVVAAQATRTIDPCAARAVVSAGAGRSVGEPSDYSGGGLNGDVSYSSQGCRYAFGDDDIEVAILTGEKPGLYAGLRSAAADKAEPPVRTLKVGTRAATSVADDEGTTLAVNLTAATLWVEAEGATRATAVERLAKALGTGFTTKTPACRSLTAKVMTAFPGAVYGGEGVSVSVSDDVAVSKSTCSWDLTDDDEVSIGVSKAADYAAWRRSKLAAAEASGFVELKIGVRSAFVVRDDFFGDQAVVELSPTTVLQVELKPSSPGPLESAIVLKIARSLANG
jgi:hypothetical protein